MFILTSLIVLVLVGKHSELINRGKNQIVIYLDLPISIILFTFHHRNHNGNYYLAIMYGYMGTCEILSIPPPPLLAPKCRAGVFLKSHGSLSISTPEVLVVEIISHSY